MIHLHRISLMKNFFKSIAGQVAKRKGAWLRAGRPGFDPWSRWGEKFSSHLRVQTDPWIHSAFYKISTHHHFSRGYRRPSVGLATLPLPSAVAVYMWTLHPHPLRALMACNGNTFTFYSIYCIVYIIYYVTYGFQGAPTSKVIGALMK